MTNFFENNRVLVLVAIVLVVGLFFDKVITGQVSRNNPVVKGSGAYGGCLDNDGDGYFIQRGCGTTEDCNDNNPLINSDMDEICNNQLDDDCDGAWDEPRCVYK